MSSSRPQSADLARTAHSEKPGSSKAHERSGDTMSKLPHMPSPCQDCPFRKDSLQGWLGASRMDDYLRKGSFVCHKKHDFQCAGHMLIKGDENTFVQVAGRLRIPLNLTGRELVFDTQTDCINHHYDSPLDGSYSATKPDPETNAMPPNNQPGR